MASKCAKFVFRKGALPPFNPRDGRPPDFFIFTFVEKKPEPGKLTIFLSGKKWRYDATLLQTCHSSRFNPDIPIFQYRSRSIPISCVKIPVFCFVLKLEKQKGVSRCRMSHVSKPTKCGLKINFIMG